MAEVMDFTKLSFEEKVVVARYRLGNSLIEAGKYGDYMHHAKPSQSTTLHVSGDFCKSERIKTAIFELSKNEICLFIPTLPANTPEYNVVYNEFKIGAAVEGFLGRKGKLHILVNEDVATETPLRKILQTYNFFHPEQITYAQTDQSLEKGDEKVFLITGDDNLYYSYSDKSIRGSAALFDTDSTAHFSKLFSKLRNDPTKTLTL